jgi:cytochrome P450
VIDRRRAEAGERDDLLSALLQELDGPALRDELVTFLLAGHETTANALVWSFHLLGRHPAVAARLRDETADALGGRAPTLDDLPRLAYARMVLEEAMRLYPPVWVVDRNTIAEDVIGGCRIRRGTLVMLSQWVTHRHPDFWPEPERFDPERFAPDAAKARPRFAYFPFAGGPRACIGSQFAMVEATMLLAGLIGRFALRPAGDGPVELSPGITLRPRHGVPMRVTALTRARAAV